MDFLNSILDRTIDNVIGGVMFESVTTGRPYGHLNQEASAYLDKVAVFLDHSKVDNPREKVQNAWDAFCDESGITDGTHRSEDKRKARDSRSKRRKMFDKHFKALRDEISKSILSVFKEKYGVNKLDPKAIQGEDPDSLSLRSRIIEARNYVERQEEEFDELVGAGIRNVSGEQVREVVISSAFNYPRVAPRGPSQLKIDKEDSEYQRWNSIVNQYNAKLEEMYNSASYNIGDVTINMNNVPTLMVVVPEIFGKNALTLEENTEYLFDELLSKTVEYTSDIDDKNNDLSEDILRDKLYSPHGPAGLAHYLYSIFNKIINRLTNKGYTDTKGVFGNIYNKSATEIKNTTKLPQPIISIMERMNLILKNIEKYRLDRLSHLEQDLRIIREDLEIGGSELGNNNLYGLLYTILENSDNIVSYFTTKHKEIMSYSESEVDRMTNNGMPNHIGDRIVKMSMPISYFRREGSIEFDSLWTGWNVDEEEDQEEIEDVEDAYEDTVEDPDASINSAEQLFKAASSKEMLNGIATKIVTNNIYNIKKRTKKIDGPYIDIGLFARHVSLLANQNKTGEESERNKVNKAVKQMICQIIKSCNKYLSTTPIPSDPKGSRIHSIIDNLIKNESWEAIELIANQKSSASSHVKHASQIIKAAMEVHRGGDHSKNEDLVRWAFEYVKGIPNVHKIDLNFNLRKNPKEPSTSELSEEPSRLATENVVGSYASLKSFGLDQNEALKSMSKIFERKDGLEQAEISAKSIFTFSNHNPVFVMKVYFADLLVDNRKDDLNELADINKRLKTIERYLKDKENEENENAKHNQFQDKSSEFAEWKKTLIHARDIIITRLTNVAYNHYVMVAGEYAYLLRSEVSESELDPVDISNEIATSNQRETLKKKRSLLETMIMSLAKDENPDMFSALSPTTGVSEINNYGDVKNSIVINDGSWIVRSDVNNPSYHYRAMNEKVIEIKNIFSQMLSLEKMESIESQVRAAGMSGVLEFLSPMKKSKTGNTMDDLIDQLKKAYSEYKWHNDNLSDSDLKAASADTETILQKSADSFPVKFDYVIEFTDSNIKISKRNKSWLPQVFSKGGEEVTLQTSGLRKEDLMRETASYIFHRSGVGKSSGIRKYGFDIEDSKFLYLTYDELKLAVEGLIPTKRDIRITRDKEELQQNIEKSMKDSINRYGAIIGRVVGKMDEGLYEVDVPKHELQMFVINSDPARITPTPDTSSAEEIELDKFLEIVPDEQEDIKHQAIEMLKNGEDIEQIKKKITIRLGAISQ
jgi:hypothetical protein